MTSEQGDISLLQHPIAQELLSANIPARLAYTWKDGTPRVIPIFFLWTGSEFIIFSPPTAPKMKALQPGSKVAFTVDTNEWPCKSLLVRGYVRIEKLQSAAQIADIGERYIGRHQAEDYASQFEQWFPESYRISIVPEWVALINYQDRWPSAMARAMSS